LSAALYFTRAKPNPEARQRYVDESIRVLRVLDGELEAKAWLVGGKCTAADLVFVPYMWSMEVCQNLSPIRRSKLHNC
jgi:glutathione S-transferase